MEAITLARYPFREADERLVLFTEEGKKIAIARGSKKLLSKNSGNLEPATRVLVELIQGKQLTYIGSTSCLDRWLRLHMEQDRRLLAQHAVTIVERLSHEDQPDPVGYHLLCQYLTRISEQPLSPLLPHYFLYQWLKHHGLAPTLVGEAAARWSVEHGGLVGQTGEQLTDGVVNIFCVLSGQHKKEMVPFSSDAIAHSYELLRAFGMYHSDRQLPAMPQLLAHQSAKIQQATLRSA